MPVTDPYGEKPTQSIPKRPVVPESHIHESFPKMDRINPSHEGSQSESPSKEDPNQPIDFRSDHSPSGVPLRRSLAGPSEELY